MAPGEQLELARSLGLASMIAVPLAARGRTLGVLVLVRDDPSTPFVEEDQALAGMLGARAGLAVDNARLYAEREYVAETLRRSLLPPELPAIEGLDRRALSPRRRGSTGRRRLLRRLRGRARPLDSP